MKKAEIIDLVDQYLSPLGFKRGSDTWNRTYLNYVDVIDIQWSSYQDSFTFNIGVCEPDIYKRCWGRKVSNWLFGLDCTIEYRIGYLVGARDTWWEYVDLDRSAFEVEFDRMLSGYVLPLFRRNHSTKGTIQEFERKKITPMNRPQDVVNFALLVSRSGEHQRARDLLAAGLEKAMGSWRESMANVLSSLPS